MATPSEHVQPQGNNNATGASPFPPGTTIFIMPPPVIMELQYSFGRVQVQIPMMEFIRLTRNGNANDNGEQSSLPSVGMIDALHRLFMQHQQSEQGPPPTNKNFLEHIPKTTWSLMNDTSHNDCAICLCEYEPKDQVVTLPCKHVFHEACGLHWLKDHNVCPTCRHELPKEGEQWQAPASPISVDASTSVLGVRRERSTPNANPRASQRRRTNENILHRVSSKDELDELLETEATAFIEEEQRASTRNTTLQSSIDMSEEDADELIKQELKSA